MFSKLYFFLFTFFTIICFKYFSECTEHPRKSFILPKCQACENLVESFLKGIKKTENNNFDGGNTAWEEKNLGSYSTSEVRFVEIQENLCKENETTMEQCQALAETFEDYLEQWWLEDRWEVPDLRVYLCVIKTKYCMPKSTSSLPIDPDPTPKGQIPSGNNCPKGFKALDDSCEDINECSVYPCKKDEYCTNTQGSFSCRKCHHNCLGCFGPGAYECKEYNDIVHFIIGGWATLHKLTVMGPSLFYALIFIAIFAKFVFGFPLLPNIFLLFFVFYFVIKVLDRDKHFDHTLRK